MKTTALTLYDEFLAKTEDKPVVAAVLALTQAILSTQGHTLGEWLSSREAAELLKVSRKTIYKMIDDGELRHERVRGQIRIRREDVENFGKKPKVIPGGSRRGNSWFAS